MEIVFGIILIIAALFLVIAVLLQSGKSHNLSGAIAGGADTFFGKSKGKTIDKALSVATAVVAIIFVILVILVYITQGSASDQYLAEHIGDAEEVEEIGEDIENAVSDEAEVTGEVTEAEETEAEVEEGAEELADEVSEAAENVEAAVEGETEAAE